MKRIISILITVLLFLSLPLSFVNAESTSNYIIYVAVDGDDGNSGTIDAPLATLFGARDKIREIKNTSGLPEGGIKVYVRGGLYTLEESFTLTEEDSGTENAPIVYQEYPGEKVEITGGVYIPGKAFKKVKDEKILDRFYPEVRDKIVSVNLSDYGFTDFGTWDYNGKTYEPFEIGGETQRFAVPGLMVFCDDEPLDIARVPNRNELLGWDYYEVGAESKIKSPANGLGATFGYTDDKIERWATYEDVAVYGFWPESWKFESSVIHSVDYNNKTITLKHKLGSGPVERRRYVYLNVLDELDTQGEYYIDKNTGTLYLYARENLKNERVGVTKFGRDARKDHLIFCDHASYITLRGFDITLARTNGVYIKAGRNVQIDNCEIKNIGRTAAGIGVVNYTDSIKASRGMRAVYSTDYMYDAGTQQISREEWEKDWAGYNHKITNSVIKNTGSWGVFVSGGDILEVEKSNHLIENCDISYVGWYESVLASGGVRIEGMGNTVRGCSIHHTPAGAVLFDGCDLIMEYNDCYKNCIDISDMGVFYSCGWFNEHNLGTEIRYNYVHDVDNVGYPGDAIYMVDGSVSRHGVYNDNCQPFLEVHHNIFANLPSGLYQASGYENNWYDNLFINVMNPIRVFGNNGASSSYNSKGHPFWYVGMTNFINPLFTENEKFKEYYPQWEPVKEKMLERGAACWQPDQIISGNVMTFYETPEFFTTSFFKETVWTPGIHGDFCTVENNFITKNDIGFVDIDRGDYRFREDAKIFETHPEMKKLDISKIGYKKNRYSEITDNSVILKVNEENAVTFGEISLADSQNPEIKPFIENGRTLVPIRFISEAFGAEVSYNDGVVTVKTDDKEIKMEIGETKYTISDEEFTMEAAPKITDGRTFVPLRAVSEALSKKVFWDDRGLIVISNGEINEEADKEAIDKILDYNY